MGFTLVITDEGAAFLATIIANQGTINFTEVQYSTTNYSASPATVTAGTFSGTFKTDATPSASVVDSTTINVSSSIDNTGILADTALYSIGVFADDGNGTTALVAICVTSTADIISAFTGTASTYAYNINFAVSSTEDITVTASTAGMLYVADIVDNLTSSATNKALSANQGKALSDAKQNKVLDTPLVIDGTTETTVEGALGALKDRASGGGRNLLYNPWFTVNQRAVTSTSVNEAFISDRWRIYLVNGTVESDGTITVQRNNATGPALYQILPYDANMIGKTVTMSIMYGDGTIDSGTITVPSSGTANVTFDHVRLRYGTSNGNLQFNVDLIDDTQVNVKAVKLEIGTASTLDQDIAPDYSEELLKCQRFFYRILAGSETVLNGLGWAYNTTNHKMGLTLPVPMRISTPTGTFAGTINLVKNGATFAVSAMTVSSGSGNIQPLTFTSTGLTGGSDYIVVLATNAYIELSAELS